MKKLISLTLALVLMAFTVSGITAFAAQAPSVNSDTPKAISIAQGKYTFKFTVSGASSLSVTVGSSAVLKVISAKQSGNAYLVTVTGIKEGSTGVYTTLPGQKGVCQCVVTVSTSTNSGSISAKYYGATYGAESQAQYNEILNYAAQVPSSSRYTKNFNYNESSQGGFESFYKVPYSEDANRVASIIGSIPFTTAAAGSSGNAYIAYTQSASNCADDAKAIQAALNVAGYNCKLVWGTDASGTPHMWTSTYFDGAWHEWGSAKFSNGTPAGYSEQGSGYNT